MTMDYKKKYENALEWARQVINGECGFIRNDVEEVFPELKESENERIRKGMLQGFKDYGEPEYVWWDGVKVKECIAWLEKQDKQDVRYKHLEELLAADDIYQMSMNQDMVEEAKTKAINALSKLCISELLLEKQGEQNHEFHGIAESRPAKGTLKKLADNIEKPKFKVEYANNEYNVLEIKEIAGVTYFGIEDEPNHIDYILPDNCEIISDHNYGVKEKGNPYPTKAVIFSGQNPAWSEEDEEQVSIITNIVQAHCGKLIDCRANLKWLESLKERLSL